MSVISGILGAIYSKTGASIAMTTEATTANAERTVYTIDDATKRYIDKDSTITVYVNASPVTDYSIELGTINFSVPRSVGAVVTISGKYFDIAQVAGFFNFKISLVRDMTDATTFGDTWKKQEPVKANWSATAEEYWLTEDISESLGSEYIIIFYLDVARSIRYEGFGILSKDDIECTMEALIKESLEFQGNGQLFYRED